MHNVKPPAEKKRKFKYCPRCENFKHVSAFNRNRARKDGLGSYCSSCHREAQRRQCRACSIPITCGDYCAAHLLSQAQLENKSRAGRLGGAALRDKWNERYRGLWASLNDHQRADWLREAAKAV